MVIVLLHCCDSFWCCTKAWESIRISIIKSNSKVNKGKINGAVRYWGAAYGSIEKNTERRTLFNKRSCSRSRKRDKLRRSFGQHRRDKRRSCNRKRMGSQQCKNERLRTGTTKDRRHGRGSIAQQPLDLVGARQRKRKRPKPTKAKQSDNNILLKINWNEWKLFLKRKTIYLVHGEVERKSFDTTRCVYVCQLASRRSLFIPGPNHHHTHLSPSLQSIEFVFLFQSK